MFHHDALHQGVNSDQAIDSTNVANLGLRWQANVAGSYTSPVVVYNATLDETLVMVGSNNVTFAAYDATTGDRVWFYKSPVAIQSSPVVDGNVVYFGANDHYLYALDATTGALICRFNAGATVYSSPVVADPDGAGKLVYFGDSGPRSSVGSARHTPRRPGRIPDHREPRAHGVLLRAGRMWRRRDRTMDADAVHRRGHADDSEREFHRVEVHLPDL
jgi:hypothetical protein